MIDMTELGTIGKLLVKIEAEGGEKANKQVEKIRQNIKRASVESAYHLPKINRFFRRWGMSLKIVSGLFAGMSTMMLVSRPLISTYLGAFLDMIGAIADGLLMDFKPALDKGLAAFGGFVKEFFELRRELEERGVPMPGFAAFGLMLRRTQGRIGERIRNFIGSIKEPIAEAWNALKEPLVETLTAVWESIKEPVWGMLKGMATGLLGWVWNSIMSNMDAIYNFVADVLIGGVNKIFSRIANRMVTHISNAKQQIIQHLQGLIPWFTVFLRFVKKTFKSAKTWMVTYIYLAKQKIEEYIDALREKVRNFVSWAREKLASIRERMSRAKESILEKARSIVGRQTGGPVFPGNPYIVGERGPELFIPSTSGRIEPLPAAGGDLHLTVKVELDGRQIWESIRRYSMDDLRRFGAW